MMLKLSHLRDQWGPLQSGFWVWVVYTPNSYLTFLGWKTEIWESNMLGSAWKLSLSMATFLSVSSCGQGERKNSSDPPSRCHSDLVTSLKFPLAKYHRIEVSMSMFAYRQTQFSTSSHSDTILGVSVSLLSGRVRYSKFILYFSYPSTGVS